ncbi:MAG TPA: DUF4166 domain-containing protein [Pirellulales bacterium]|nr:DUF4166 domain-containing protein [Pirellulales bacterium]
MLKSSLRSPSGLYPKLLGDSWRNLHPAVRRLHSSDAPACAVGVFQIWRGTNWLARTLARLARLPRAGEAVNVRLFINARDDGEEWRRIFADKPFVTLQSDGGDGLLTERVGRAEVRFRLKVVDGVLTYQSARAALCLGAWRVRLPRWCAPQITACESAAGEGDQIDVSVEVRLPWLGRLVAYHGKLTQAEARAC